MSSAVPSVARPTDCCSTSCDSTATANIPGPAGPAGAAGTNGTDGENSFTTIAAQFVMPAVSGTVVVTVADSSWAAIGQKVFVQGAGYFTVTAVTDGTHMTLENTGYTGNAAPAAIIAVANQVSPGGIKGTDGAAGTTDINDVSPTTTKGDVMVDNGANDPNPNVVRLGVGTDGQIFSAVATQPTGVQWQTLIPIAGTDNGIPRFNGASGTPIPLQTSKVVINDQGAIQASGSGGNARGTDAVDLQVTRGAATQVASGLRAFAGAGTNNTVSGDDAAIVGGASNTASNDHAFVGAGTNNTASGSDCAICSGDGNSATDVAFVGAGQTNAASGAGSVVTGGYSNTASAQSAVVSGGDSNSATHVLSTVPGGANAVANKHGQLSHASGKFADNGDAQATELVWRINTTDATPTVEMFLDGAADVATIPANTSWVVSILLVGRSSAGVEAMWKAEGGIHNNAGTTAVTAAFTVASIADGTGGTWGVAGNFAVTADNAADSLKLAVTGSGGTLIRWVAHARIVEVHY